MNSTNRLAAMLFNVVANAPDEDQTALFIELDDFRSTFGRSYADVKKQPFARALLEAIEEAERYVECNDD